MTSLYELKAADASGTEQSLEAHRGKVLLIVNTASKCGFTPQYEGLQKLYEQYADQGLEIIGFPCNQFGAQEPGSDDEIQSFCSLNYSVSFPVMAKIDVNGANTHPVYQYLKSSAKGLLGSEGIKWNFTKFLVDREGNVVDRFAPTTTPKQLEDKIKALL